MLTIENIYTSRTLERHSEGIFVNNQRILMLAPIADGKEHPDYYIGVTGYNWNEKSIPIEIVIARKHKKLKIPMIPFKNDSKWS